MDMTLVTTRGEIIPGIYGTLLSLPPPRKKVPHVVITKIYIFSHKAPEPSSRPTGPTSSSEWERDPEDLGNFISSLRKVDVEDLGPDRIDRECRIFFEPYRQCVDRAAATPDANSLYMSISGEDPVCLPCNHIFGQQCIKKWLRGHDQCPKRRRELLPPIIDP